MDHPLEKNSKNIDFSFLGKQCIVLPKWTFFRVLAHCTKLETLVGEPKIHEHYYFLDRQIYYKLLGMMRVCVGPEVHSGETLEFNARFDDAF